MAELDPLTNLPKQADPVEQIAEIREKAASAPKGEVKDVFYFLSRNAPDMSPSPVYGTFGEYSGINVASDRNFNEIRARNQGAFELISKSAAQAIGSTAGMMLEASGYLIDIPENIIGAITGEEKSFERNPLSQMGKDLTDWTREIAPIYLTDVAQSNSMRRFLDATFYASNVPTVFSAFAIMIPAMGVSWGAGALAGLARASIGARRFAQAVGGAIAGREMEANMEANEIYETQLEEYLNRGMSREEAHARASQEAMGVYGASYSNLALDVPSWMIGLRGVNLSNRALRKSITELAENTQQPFLQAVRQQLINNPALTTKKAIEKAGFKSWADFVVQAGLEGFEEFNIEIQKERVLNNSRILAGEIEGDYRGLLDVYLSGDFTQYLDNPEIINAAVFGALGGAFMGGLQRLAAMKANRKQVELEIEQASILEQQAQHLQDRLKKVTDSLLQGDEIGAEEQFRLMISDLAIKGIASEEGFIPGAAHAGNLDNFREMLEGVTQLTNEELQQLDLDPSIKQNAERALEEVARIEEIYDRNSQKVHGTDIDHIINMYLAEQEYVNHVMKEGLDQYDKKLSDLYNDPATKSMLDQLDADQRDYVHKIRQVDALKEEKKKLEELHLEQALGSVVQMKISSNARKRSIEEINERIATLEEAIKQDETDIDKSKISEAKRVRRELDRNTDITDLERFKLAKEYELKEGEFTLGELLKSYNQADIARSIKSNQEEITRQVNEFLVDEDLGDQAYIEYEGKFYLYEKDPDNNRTLQEVDQEMNIIEDAPSIKVPDLDIFLDNYRKIDPDHIYSQEKFDELNKEIDVSLKNKDYGTAIDILNNQIYLSNFSNQSSAIADDIFTRIGNDIKNAKSIPEIRDLQDFIYSRTSNQRIKHLLKDAIEARITEIQQQNEAQIKKFNEMFELENKRAEEILEQQERIEKRIAEIESIIEERRNEVRKLAERKNRTQKSILSTHHAVRRRLNEAVENTKQELSDLKKQRRNIRRQLDDINKNLDVFQKFKNKFLEDQETPGIIVKEALEDALSQEDAIRAEILVDFNMTDYGLNKLKKIYENSLDGFDASVKALTRLRDSVITLHKGSDIAYNAAHDAFKKMEDDGFISSEDDILSDTLFERFKNLYNKNLTDALKNASGEEWSKHKARGIVRIVNALRLTDAQHKDLWDNIVSDIRKEIDRIGVIGKHLDSLRELKDVIPIYKQIIDGLRKAYLDFTRSVDPVKVVKDPTPPEVSDFFNPKRTLEHVFNRLAGSQGTTYGGMSEDPAQRRYARFISTTNLNDNAGDYRIEIVKPESVGIVIDNLPEKYDPDEILYAIVQTKDGKYVTEDGVTDTFDPNTSIYTSVPLADYLSDRMSKTFEVDDNGQLIIDEVLLKKMYPKDTLEVATEKYKKYAEDLKLNHQRFLDEVHERLNKGERVYRNVIGKSNGVVNEVENKTGEPKKLIDYFGERVRNSDEIELRIIQSNTVEIGGEIYTLQPGSVIVYDKKTGNFSPGANRVLRKNEIDTIVESLRYMVENSTIKGNRIDTTVPLKNKDGENLTKIVKGKTSDVYFTDVIKSFTYFGSEGSKIRFLEGSKVPGGQLVIKRRIIEDGEVKNIIEETYDIFANKDGKKINQLNPALEKALREELSQTIHNVESRDFSQPYTSYSFEDGSFSAKNYDSYRNYILDENVIGTWLADIRTETVIEDGVEVSERGVTHYNQNIYYDNRPSEAAVEEVAETTEEVVEPTEEVAEPAEPVIETPAVEVPPVDIDDIMFPEDAGPTEEQLENATLITEEMIQSIEESIEEQTTSKKEDAGKKEDTEKIEAPDIDDLLGFQRISSGPILTDRQLNNLSSELSRRTGIPMHILTPERSLTLLETMRESGRIKERFTLETLPKGMYDRGVSYVFSDKQVSYETPFHEISHPIVNQIISDNHVLFENLVKEIESSPEGRKIKAHVAEHYPDAIKDGELTMSAWAEIITTAIGRDAANLYYGRANEGLRGMIKNLWERIKQFFRDVLGDSIHINELSPDTTIGDLARILALTQQNIVVTPSVVTQFQRIDTSPNVLPGKDSKFTLEATETFNYIFFRRLMKDNINSLPLLFAEKGLRGDLYKDTINHVKEEMTKLRDVIRSNAETYRSQGAMSYYNRFMEVSANYQYLLDNWGKLVELHGKYLSRYNIEAVTDETFSQEEGSRDANELWAINALKYSAKHNATSNIRLLMGAMKSNKKRPSDSAFFSTNFADFGTLFNLLANTLSNNRDLQKMKEIIETKLKNEDGVEFLLNTLLSKMIDIDQISHAEAQMLLEFRKTFAKHYNDYSTLLIDEDNNYSTIDATINTSKRRLLDSWRKNVDPRKPNFKVKGNVVVYDLDSMRERGMLNTESLRTNDYFLPKTFDTAIQREYLRSVNFLKELGIEITTSELPSNPAEFNKRVDYIYKDLYDGVEIDVLSNYSDHRENVRHYIAEHEIANSLNAIENSHYRSGETIYNVNLYSYTTLVSDKLNEIDHRDSLIREMPHLTDPYNNNSLILNKSGVKDPKYNFLFDENGNRTENNLEIIFIDEFINENTNKANVFSKLSGRDQTLITINGVINGNYPVFRPGDNSIERHITMMKFFLSNDITDGKHYPVFHDYLTDELNSIIYRLDSPEIYQAFAGKSVEELLRLYPVANILMDSKNIRETLIRAIEDRDVSAFRDGKTLQHINNVIKKYFDKEFVNTDKYLVENGILERATDGYINKGLSGMSTGKVSTAVVKNVLTEAIVNRFVANIEQTKLFTGPLVFYNNPDNLFKRTSGMVGTKDVLATGDFETRLINKLYPRNSKSKRLYKSVGANGELSEATTEYTEGAKRIFRTQIFEDPKVRSSYLDSLPEEIKRDVYASMDEADAVGFISLDAYRDMHIMAGTWNMSKERLYQWETRGDTKEITFTNWYTNKVETVKGYKDLLNIDGSPTVFNVSKPQYFGPLAENGFVPAMYKTALIPVLPSYVNSNMKSLYKHLEDSNIDIVTFPSANKVGTMSNEDGSIPNPYNEEGLPNLENGIIQDTWGEYWGIQLDTGSTIKNNVIKGTQFMKMITSTIYSNGVAVNEELGKLAGELISINNALIDKGIAELIEELGLVKEGDRYTVESVNKLLDFLEKEARSRDANDNVLTSLGYLKNSWSDTDLGLDILSNKDKVENILASIADSRVIRQMMPGGAKVQVPSTFFENGVRKYANKEAQELSSNFLKFYEEEGVMEVMLPHHFKEIYRDIPIETIEDALKIGIGFRIPTSGLNSIEKIKVVGYLPKSAGETIVLPSEIVAKAGSDFDIDKLNVFLPNYKIVKGKPVYIAYDPKKGPAGNSRQQLENRLIEIAGEIISHPDNRKYLLEPIGTDDIKAQELNIIEKLELDTSRKSMTDAVGNFEYYMEVTKRNLESKQLTGVAALHSADHVHSMRHGYYYNDEKFTIHLPHNKTKEGFVSLGSRENVAGEYIPGILNQMVNAAVDGAKEPIFYNLNTNMESAGVIFFLIRAGVPLKDVFEFVNEPIIREYVRLQRIRKSVSSTDLTNKKVIAQAIANTDSKNNEKALKALDYYREYEKAAQNLGDYMQATKLDTQSLGKNTSELDLILHGAKQVLDGNTSIGNSQKLLEKGGFLHMYYEALKDFDLMFEGFFINKRIDWFRDVYQEFLSKYVYHRKMLPFESKVRILDKFKTDLINSTVLNHPIDIFGVQHPPIAGQLDLIIGNNTVAKQLADYQQRTKDDPSRNMFAHALQPIIGKEKYELYGERTFIDSVRLYDQRMDTVEVDSMIDSYRELFNDEPDLAINLAKLAFLQGGLQLTPMAFTKFIPSEVYMEMISSAFKNQPEARSSKAFIRNFFLSNYNDPELVPTKIGKHDPESWIWKQYLPLNLTKEQLEERRRLGQPTYANTPVIYINLEKDHHLFDLFADIRESGKYGKEIVVRSNAIRDNRNNVNLLYYGSRIAVAPRGRQPVEIGNTKTTLEMAEEIRRLCQ